MCRSCRRISTFDAAVLEDAFRQHPKAMILCNPSNPCGKVFTRAGAGDLSRRSRRKYDTYVITDEVYEHIVFAPHKHTYFATLPGMWERTLSCSSLSKTYSVTGWRLGYIIAPPEIIDRAKKVHDFLTVGAAAPLAGGCCHRSEVRARTTMTTCWPSTRTKRSCSSRVWTS